MLPGGPEGLQVALCSVARGHKGLQVTLCCQEGQRDYRLQCVMLPGGHKGLQVAFFLLPGGPEGLEEEYNLAVAANIVQELLFQQRSRDKAADSSAPSTPATSTPVGSMTNINNSSSANSGYTTSVRSSRPASTRGNTSAKTSRVSVVMCQRRAG